LANCEQCEAALPKGAQFCPACGVRAGEVVQEEFSVSADNLVSTVKELIHEGNVTRIVIRDEQRRTLLDMPVTVGFVGVVLAPWLAALGAIAALATRCTIAVERRA
jgi:hypothetical protein